MSSLPQIDPLAIFFERHGHYLQTRQLDFCRFMLVSGDQTKSARKAGFINPESDGAVLYSMYRATLDIYREHEDLDKELVMSVYRQMAVAKNTIMVEPAKPPEDGVPGTDAVYEKKPNFSVMKGGADGLCKVHGFNAAEKVDMDLTARAELPPSLKEKLANAYK